MTFHTEIIAGQTAIHADCLDALKSIPDNSIDALVTDPPAGIAFMGKKWDGDKGGRQQWTAWLEGIMRECHRVLKPGAHGLVWALPRTSHWAMTAIEDAGFEIREKVYHCFGSGFPKNFDVSKAIDREAGAEREILGPKIYGDGKPCHYVSQKAMDASAGKSQSGRTTHNPATAPATEAARQWEGWGTALKPAIEEWILCRKPLIGTIAQNVMEHGTGALNIGDCKVGTDSRINPPAASKGNVRIFESAGRIDAEDKETTGRWPANLILSDDPEVRALFPETKGQIGGNNDPNGSMGYHGGGRGVSKAGIPDQGSAARFFYQAKADKDDRCGSKHPTVKNINLIAYLCRLITPPGGTILDCFAGSGTTGAACIREGFKSILIEREAEYYADILNRLKHATGENAPLFACS